MWQTCISSSRLAAAALLLTFAPDESAHAQSREPLASVMLRFEVISGQYRNMLRDSLTVLQQVMGDSVREMLQARFPFVKWNLSSARAADTMVVRVTPAPNSTQTHVLEIALVSASAAAVDPFRTAFEKSEEFGARRDWAPRAVAGSWLVRAHGIFENESQRIVEHVISRLPIAAPVDIDTDKLKVVVGVATERLEAADSPEPKFRVVVTVVDSGPRGQRTRGAVQLQLGGCRVDEHKAYFYCDIDSVTYVGRTRPAHHYRDLLKHAKLSPASLHLVVYRARPRRSSGAVTGRPVNR